MYTQVRSFQYVSVAGNKPSRDETVHCQIFGIQGAATLGPGDRAPNLPPNPRQHGFWFLYSPIILIQKITNGVHSVQPCINHSFHRPARCIQSRLSCCQDRARFITQTAANPNSPLRGGGGGLCVQLNRTRNQWLSRWKSWVWATCVQTGICRSINWSRTAAFGGLRYCCVVVGRAALSHTHSGRGRPVQCSVTALVPQSAALPKEETHPVVVWRLRLSLTWLVQAGTLLQGVRFELYSRVWKLVVRQLQLLSMSAVGSWSHLRVLSQLFSETWITRTRRYWFLPHDSTALPSTEASACLIIG